MFPDRTVSRTSRPWLAHTQVPAETSCSRSERGVASLTNVHAGPEVPVPDLAAVTAEAPAAD